MKLKSILPILITFLLLTSCSEKKEEVEKIVEKPKTEHTVESNDNRIPLNLNEKQKKHQLENMRDHLEAVQHIITLIAIEDYDRASETAKNRLGSTTEMKLMCASFGNKQFEELGFKFHSDADKMSEVLKTKDKNKSLHALSKTMSSCISCHEIFKSNVIP